MRSGLCQSCKHVKLLESSRGSVFYMCRLAETDSRFARYPSLPVLQCRGYERAAAPQSADKRITDNQAQQ